MTPVKKPRGHGLRASIRKFMGGRGGPGVIRMGRNPKLGFCLVCLLLGVFAACGPPSEKQRMLRLMDGVKRAAEKKDLRGMADFLSEDYADFEGRGKKETEGLLRDYFHRYRGIVVHVLGTRFEEAGPGGETELELEVVLSSGRGETFRKLLRFSGEYYRFQIGVIKAGNLRRIRSARWGPVAAGDLFPESLAILKSLFPDI